MSGSRGTTGTDGTDWLRRAGSLAQPGRPMAIDPKAAGWPYSGMQILDLAAMPEQHLDLRDTEAVLLSLSSPNVRLEVDGTIVDLTGRSGVFAGVSDWAYLPVGSQVRVTGEPGEVALCTAVAEQVLPMQVVRADAVPVEVRGAGQATRQVNNIATPTSFTGAQRINVCEVLTPGGNWSSWPPHRHDGLADCPYQNEEIYYFRMGNGTSDHGTPDGGGLFRIYTVDGSVDQTWTIWDGDVVLVPQGYHGPTVAPPEYPMYFLNVLAGPGAERTMGFCDDPAHHWIRQAWEAQDQDPRCPMTTAKGKVSR